MTTGKVIVCACEDVSLAEIHDAIADGYDDLETIKRYTGLATGPCQGKACVAACRLVLARITDRDPAEVGVITFRPPSVPIPLRYLAGPDAEDAP